MEKDCDNWKNCGYWKIVVTEKNHDYWKRLWLLKKIVITEKDCDYWKKSWLLKKIVVIEKDCDKIIQ